MKIIAWASKPFHRQHVYKRFPLNVAEMMCPENKQTFENVSGIGSVCEVYGQERSAQVQIPGLFFVAANEKADMSDSTLVTLYLCGMVSTLKGSKNF